MNRLSLALACALVAVAMACKKSGRAPECGLVGNGFDAVVKHQIESAPANMRAHIEQLVVANANRTKGAMIEMCRSANWSATTVDCFAAAKKPTELQACYATLSEPQKASAEKARKSLEVSREKDPNRPGDCAGAAAKVARLQAQVRAGSATNYKYSEAINRACSADAWLGGVTDCYLAAESIVAAEACAAKLSPTAAKRLSEALAQP